MTRYASVEDACFHQQIGGMITLRRFLVLLMGFWVGGLTTLLLSGFRVFRFSFSLPPLGIVNKCAVVGYPKQQDYFWFAAAVALPCLAATGFSFLRDWLIRRNWGGRWSYFPLLASLMLLGMSTWLAFTRSTSSMVVGAIAGGIGALVFWFDRAVLAAGGEKTTAASWSPQSRKSSLAMSD